MPLDLELRAAYLRRLGVDAEPPSLEALQQLHRRHVERVPYETMWIHAGQVWGIDPLDSVARIARHGRGGYCYHLNGALGALLRSLGYAVSGHVGGVHGPAGPDAESVGNHLVLMVSDLPTDENPAGIWYVDAGLGDALHEPLPLLVGAYEQAPFQLVLDDRVGEWHLTHDPAGSFAGMSWRTADAELGDFAAKHQWLSTSPDSGFVQVAVAERRDAAGVGVMRGLVLSRVGERAGSSEPMTERPAWFAALADIFDLRFDGCAPDTLDHLWNRVLARHHAWEARRP